MDLGIILVKNHGMKDQWLKMKQKLASIITKPHLAWKEWELIWNYLSKKELLPQGSSWWEFEVGINAEALLTHTQRWGRSEGSSVSKIALDLTRGPITTLTIKKNQSELASCEAPMRGELVTFWRNLFQQSMSVHQKTITDFMYGSRLKLVNDDYLGIDPTMQEQKVLQWIKTSLMVLEGALTQVQHNSQQFITARILMGKLPLQEFFQIHIHCFNLEISALTKDGKEWQVLAYDHKEFKKTEIEPVLSATVRSRPKELCDMLNGLIQKIFEQTLP